MPLNPSVDFINWSAFLVTSSIICLRFYLPSVCLAMAERLFPSSTVDALTNELKQVTRQLAEISPQDQFAAYTRKERQRHALIQRVKDEEKTIETRQKRISTRIRLTINVISVLVVILLGFNGVSIRSLPLFNFPFFRFPLIIWIFALNTFLSVLTNIVRRYQMTPEQNTRSLAANIVG
jgi:hypothetical protein